MKYIESCSFLKYLILLKTVVFRSWWCRLWIRYRRQQKPFSSALLQEREFQASRSCFRVKYYILEQVSTDFFGEGPNNNKYHTLSRPAFEVSWVRCNPSYLITSILVLRKQWEPICKQVSVAVCQYKFVDTGIWISCPFHVSGSIILFILYIYIFKFFVAWSSSMHSSSPLSPHSRNKPQHLVERHCPQVWLSNLCFYILHKFQWNVKYRQCG